MTKSIAAFFLISFAPALTYAQDVALVFTGTIYSRDLTEEERELASERTKLLRGQDKRFGKLQRKSECCRLEPKNSIK